MIFYLDSSLSDVNDENVKSHFVDFMENLCIARKNGRHIICAEITTLNSLMALSCLGERTIAMLAKVARRVRGKLTIFEACNTYVRVVLAPGTYRKIKLPSGKDEIQISSDCVDSDELFIKPRFLVENRTDGVFYGGLAKISLSKDHQLENVILNYEIVAGGGSQTPREYKNLKEKKHLTLCMVDSDVDYLGAPLGNNTAAPIFFMDQDVPPVVSKSVILNCYSAENLIHPSMLKDVFKLQGSESWFQDLNRYYNSDYWMFLALKQKKVCSDFSAQSSKAVYWRSKRKEFTVDDCTPICIPKSCSIFKPLPSATLNEVAKYLDDGGRSFVSEIDFSDHKIFVEWSSIAKNLFSWACSGDRMSVV